MKCAEPKTKAASEAGKESVITFSTGLLGFESVKRYVLLADPEEAPFVWLQMLDEPKLSFLLVPPAFAMENYQPDISSEDVQQLGLKSGEDALVLNVVTLHGDGKATVNMKGPVVINRQTLQAKQAIPLNVAEFELQHPLDVRVD